MDFSPRSTDRGGQSVAHWRSKRQQGAWVCLCEIELRGGDIGGIAVHAAARVMAQAGPDEVLVSRVVTDLVAGAGLKFSDRGTHELKGLPGQWDIFAASA